MTPESVAIILTLVAIFLILLEFLWLYIISRNQEEFLQKKDKTIKTARGQIQAVLGSPSKSVQEYETKRFVETATKNSSTLLSSVAAYMEYSANRQSLSDERNIVLDNIYKELEPIPKLMELLKKSNKYEKAYICRCLADLGATDAIEEIRKCMHNKNHTLKYNAGMALSKLGDEEGTLDFIDMCKNNYKLSHRVVLELFHDYTGDKVRLVKKYFEDAEKDDYLKATIIKAVKNDKFVELEDIYIDGFQNGSPEVRVSSVKAMAEIGTVDLEQYLITASKDKNWILRLSAISGLEKINTPSAMGAVEKLTSDEQWWVRKRASEALIRMDSNMEHVEKIIKGYDRYASDAIKEGLYKQS